MDYLGCWNLKWPLCDMYIHLNMYFNGVCQLPSNRDIQPYLASPSQELYKVKDDSITS